MMDSFYRRPFLFFHVTHFIFWLLFHCFLFNFQFRWMPCSFSLCHRKRIINYEVKKFGRNKKKSCGKKGEHESVNRFYQLSVHHSNIISFTYLTQINQPYDEQLTLIHKKKIFDEPNNILCVCLCLCVYVSGFRFFTIQ